jgi:hypothetical protein
MSCLIVGGYSAQKVCILESLSDCLTVCTHFFCTAMSPSTHTPKSTTTSGKWDFMRLPCIGVMSSHFQRPLIMDGVIKCLYCRCDLMPMTTTTNIHGNLGCRYVLCTAWPQGEFGPGMMSHQRYFCWVVFLHHKFILLQLTIVVSLAANRNVPQLMIVSIKCVKPTVNAVVGVIARIMCARLTQKTSLSLLFLFHQHLPMMTCLSTHCFEHRQPQPPCQC